MKETVALIDERAPAELLRALRLRGFIPLTVPRHPELGEAVCSHTDMLVVRHGKNIISLSSFCDHAPAFFDDLYALVAKKGYSFVFLDDKVGRNYPEDARLNALTLGNCVFCRKTSLSPGLIHIFENDGMEIVDVKQGYPACTVMALGDKCAVTSDRGMSRALSRRGINVTEIEAGHILLPPHEYGFIGGCAGVHGDSVYFTGKIEAHPSYREILEALRSVGLSAVSLTEAPLVDLGGILFID